MCIVIDTNTISSVFNTEDKDHMEFSPVKEWIIKGRGKMVFGGSKYYNELNRLKNYRQTIAELSKARKTVIYDKDKIDTIESDLKKLLPDNIFNDHHILAIHIATGCRLLCTKDKPLIAVSKNKDIYPKGIPKPKIYSGQKNRNLLSDNNIAAICRS